MTEDDLRKQTCDYFHMHAAQRLTTFNFYVGISSLLSGGMAATIKTDPDAPLLGAVVGVLLVLFSVVFWKLDQRNTDLIKGAERALRYFESRCPLPDDGEKPHEAKRFSREEYDSHLKKNQRTWRFWQNHYSFSDCFRAVFLIFGGLGTVGLCYTLIRHWTW